MCRSGTVSTSSKPVRRDAAAIGRDPCRASGGPHGRYRDQGDEPAILLGRELEEPRSRVEAAEAIDVDEVAGFGASVEREHLVGREFVTVEDRSVLAVAQVPDPRVPRQIEFSGVGSVSDLKARETGASRTRGASSSTVAAVVAKKSRSRVRRSPIPDTMSAAPPASPTSWPSVVSATIAATRCWSGLSGTCYRNATRWRASHGAHASRTYCGR